MRLIQGRSVPPRILVVDDEESIRTLLVRILAPVGYQVDVAPGADTALEMMSASPANVALVDIRMPGHDGAWLIAVTREGRCGEPPDLHVGASLLGPRASVPDADRALRARHGQNVPVSRKCDGERRTAGDRPSVT